MLELAESTAVPFSSAAGGVWPASRMRGHGDGVLGLLVNGLVHGAALVALKDPGHALRRGVLPGGRDGVGLDPGRLEVGDHRVGEPVIGLDGGVDLRVGGERLLEDGAALGVVPAGGEVLGNQRGAAGGALRARGDRLGRLVEDHLVVTRGEGDRVGVGVLAAVQDVDLGALDAPGREALVEARADQLADLLAVEADVVGVRALEDGAVVGDQGDALLLRELRDRDAGRAVERAHDQDLGTQVDVGGRVAQLGRVAALRVVDLELRPGVPGGGEGCLQVRRVEVNPPRRRRGVGQDHADLQAGAPLVAAAVSPLNCDIVDAMSTVKELMLSPEGIVAEPLVAGLDEVPALDEAAGDDRAPWSSTRTTSSPRPPWQRPRPQPPSPIGAGTSMCRGPVNGRAALPVLFYPVASHTPFATMRFGYADAGHRQHVCPYGMKGRSWER